MKELNNEQIEMISYVADYVAEIFNTNKIDAIEMIKHSVFFKLLKENFEQVSHDGIDFWVDIIKKQYKDKFI